MFNKTQIHNAIIHYFVFVFDSRIPKGNENFHSTCTLSKNEKGEDFDYVLLFTVRSDELYIKSISLIVLNIFRILSKLILYINLKYSISSQKKLK